MRSKSKNKNRACIREQASPSLREVREERAGRAFRSLFCSVAFTFGLLLCTPAIGQQQAPAIGYMYPAGGAAGTTIDVVLGGYDWTPDMEVFIHASGIKLELTGSLSSVIVPEPPYWFGKKARRPPFLMPSETPAKLTIPADTQPGIYRWQAANANGATASGRLVVSDQREISEQPARTESQEVGSLPVIISGQILKIEEVDGYRFLAPRDGPITVSLAAAAIGSPLTAALEVRDTNGQMVAETGDTVGSDLHLTFRAQADHPYVVRVYDIDFRGNRSFVYRLGVTPSPHVIAAIPAGGKRGETRDVQFIGYGVATGGATLESVTRSVTFPTDASESFFFLPETPFGPANPVRLLLGDTPELVEASTGGDSAKPLPIPSAVTGVLDQRYGVDRYSVAGTKGDVWNVSLEADSIGSALDVSLSIVNEEGKELKRSDDLPGTTDAGLEFTVPADGTYQFVVSDSSGHSGNQAAIYRLAVRPAIPGFKLSGPELVNVALGSKTVLTIKVTRTGGFADPIKLQLTGLPAGVSVPAEIIVPAKKNVTKIELSAAVDAGTAAARLQISGEAKTGEADVVEHVAPMLLAITMKPPYSIDAEGKNDVTKWPRGTTFPAPVLVQRDDGFAGEIVLEMAAKQGRHRQGINGPEFKIPPTAQRILYPVFLPEWLETTRTSRMVVNGVAQIADPKGRVRYVSSKLKTRIGFLPTGALLKIDCDVPELEVVAGQPVRIPLTINRAKGLDETARIELIDDPATDGVLTAEPLTVDHEQSKVLLSATSLVAGEFKGEREITIRATVMQDGHLPVVSETRVLIIW